MTKFFSFILLVVLSFSLVSFSASAEGAKTVVFTLPSPGGQSCYIQAPAPKGHPALAPAMSFIEGKAVLALSSVPHTISVWCGAGGNVWYRDMPENCDYRPAAEDGSKRAHFVCALTPGDGDISFTANGDPIRLNLVWTARAATTDDLRGILTRLDKQAGQIGDLERGHQTLQKRVERLEREVPRIEKEAAEAKAFAEEAIEELRAPRRLILTLGGHASRLNRPADYDAPQPWGMEVGAAYALYPAPWLAIPLGLEFSHSTGYMPVRETVNLVNSPINIVEAPREFYGGSGGILFRSRNRTVDIGVDLRLLAGLLVVRTGREFLSQEPQGAQGVISTPGSQATFGLGGRASLFLLFGDRGGIFVGPRIMAAPLGVKNYVGMGPNTPNAPQLSSSKLVDFQVGGGVYATLF